MPLSISPALKSHIAQTTTTLATCTKMDLTDGASFYFTDHDKPISFGGNNYLPTSGYTPTASQTKIDLSVDNMEIVGVLDDINIKESDLLAGRFDYADIEVFQINYADTSMGKLIVIAGKLGEVRVIDKEYFIEIRSLTQFFQQSIGEPYVVLCAVSHLGDARCKVDLGPHTSILTVSAVDSSEPDRIFDTNLTNPDNHFDLGLVTWSSGNNSKYLMDVKTYLNANGRVELYEPMPFVINVGDQASISTGCDKTWTTCKNRYSNQLNYRGFPHLIGVSKAIRGS